ncbi:bifunctional diaminohydroxyphosphoribosylaminopyrimidine deaminase/5-amino-6-(5-phosphoribosylamino)uracil reductase RibD [Hazenella sp. IB182357]|uniref:diaminohydroxyphosphoribosylaminopyrimidine deaminase n=1 Tax=Polycladospora coralii TaxID=2771432 RepID=A0A926N690_9BACL|nr:bifunctional diaminohydroxyphosphoribosylaminopyrimidine deaminase/5-amino-6-(5-phosphoribosylamino)uracil reductase RibD [Polycladospora coralii]MBD1372604.1 bifunctional diaminohydroxyphosphoribosylaminopyrimidine deaminase/5-amino-6-(5-phosphoribosylamino)uracil reductase RibD [Polycladospora coralii]
MSMETETYMLEAIYEGRKAQGNTGTNPPVGAIIVKGGKIVGRGHTAHLGGPHAEIRALEMAGNKARGATLYCTLEPCAHYGRTGPCCVAVTNAGIKKVVIGIRDPFPKVDGKGIKYLEEQGVETEVGFYEEMIREDLATFLSQVNQ